MMTLLLHLLWYRFLGFVKLNAEWKAEYFLKSFASLVVYGGFVIGAYIVARETTAYVLDKVHLGLFLLHRFLSMMFYVFFLSINVGNIIVSYASLYRSKETEYLLTRPVSHSMLFVVKFLDNFFYSSSTMFMIAIAMLLGYGSYFGMHWTFYIGALLFVFIPFMLIAASVAVIALLLLVMLAEKIGFKAVMAGVVAGYLGTVYFYFSLTNPMDLVNDVMKYYPYVNQYFGFLDPPLAKFLPSHWAAEALYWTIRGEPLLATPSTWIILVIAAMMFTVMALVGKGWYYRTWLTIMEVKARQQTKLTTGRFMSFARPPLLDLQTSVLVKKEFWQFFREPSQWIHLGIIVMLTVVFVGSVGHIKFDVGRPFLFTVSYMVLYVFNAFLLLSIALRFVFPMVSTEGKSFWVIRAAPVSLRKVYVLKFIIAFLPILFVGEVLAIASHQRFDNFSFFASVALLVGTIVSAAVVSMNLGTGAYFSDFRESNPIRVASSQGATLTFFIGIVYLVFLVAVLFFPFQRLFETILTGAAPAWSLFTGPLAVLGLVSSALVIVSMVLGMRALRRDL